MRFPVSSPMAKSEVSFKTLKSFERKVLFRPLYKKRRWKIGDRE